MPENEAKVSIFDRGFLFADGVYEVTSVLDGKLIDFEAHALRLTRSLSELDMQSPIKKEDLLTVHRELVSTNGIEEGLIYLQITRGAASDRDFDYPSKDCQKLSNQLNKISKHTYSQLETLVQYLIDEIY